MSDMIRLRRKHGRRPRLFTRRAFGRGAAAAGVAAGATAAGLCAAPAALAEGGDGSGRQRGGKAGRQGGKHRGKQSGTLGGEGLRVLMPTGDNMQFLSYWLAHRSRYFAARGLKPQLIIPDHQRLAIERFINGAAPLAVLPAPLYFALLGSGAPMAIVANLLAHDPINLVVGAELSPKLPPTAAPLAERLAALRGLRLGVARGPTKRLAALLAAASLKPDELQIVTIKGRRQNAALAAGEVDALYAHTPYLERALVQQGARLYVDQSAGEIPALTGLLVHALVAAPAFIERAPEQVQAVVAGLVEARRAAAAQADLAASTLLSLFPERPAEEVKVIARIYGAALPKSLRPEVTAASRTRQLFPALHREELSQAQIEAVIEPRFAIAAETTPNAPNAPNAPPNNLPSEAAPNAPPNSLPSESAASTVDPSSSRRLAGPLVAMLAGGAMGWMLRRRSDPSR